MTKLDWDTFELQKLDKVKERIVLQQRTVSCAARFASWTTGAAEQGGQGGLLPPQISRCGGSAPLALPSGYE